MKRRISSGLAAVVMGIALLTSSAMSQVTTGTVTGRVIDSTGGIVPNARVVLISEARGTRSVAVVTNESGDYVFPDVTADTYTIEVTAPSFKTLRRAGILVTGGDRVGVPTLTLDVGATVETGNGTADSAMVQTQRGERS